MNRRIAARRTLTPVALLAAALIVLPAGRAGAEDDGPAAPERKHPLTDFLRDVQQAAHLGAWKRVRSVAVAESMFAAAARVDTDQDGAGEYGGLRDLTEFLVKGGESGAMQPALDPAFAKVNHDGETVVAGYVYRIFLPGAGGTGVHETTGARAARVVADGAEAAWAIYAWPRTYGRTGRFTFFAQQDGDVFAVDAPEYSGTGRGPAVDAAVAAEPAAPGSFGKARLDARARDGRVWRDAKAVRPAEIAADAIPPHAGPWRSAQRLAALGAAACDDVEKALGGPIPGGRPEVRIGTLDDVEAALRADLLPVFARMGMPEKDQGGTLGFAAASLLAKYDRRAHVILVVPATAEITAALLHAPWLLEDDALRVLLVREATHAHDFRSHPLGAAIDRVASREEFSAWSAVVEGHAQFVAERVAKSRGLAATFDLLASALSWSPKTDDPAMDAMFRTFSATLGFPYTSGLRFFHEVERQAGASAVLRALDTPPRTVREIEQPAAWLTGGDAASAVTSDAILDRFMKVIAAGWAGERAPVHVTTIRKQAETLGVTDDEHALDAVTDMQGMFAQKPPSSGTFAVLLMRTADEAGAVALERLERRISEAKDRAAATGAVRIASAGYVDGAGAGGRLPGFVALKRFESGTRSQAFVLHVARIGRCVLEITLAGTLDIERAALDTALADVAKMLEDAAKTSGGK